MAVDFHFEESLLRSLKLEDPWLPPKSWESIPSESGTVASSSPSSSHECLFDLSSVSEASLVRLVLNALQGVESAVASIEKLSALFCADLADRSRHRIPTIWNRSLSTLALGKMLKSIGFTGSLVVLLHKFVDYFMCSSLDATLNLSKQVNASEYVREGDITEHPPFSLVNQAFAVAVRTVLGGYICALDTLNASVNLRRSFKKGNSVTNASPRGSLTSISHCEVTLLEMYAHTKELRSQIEALGYLCRLCDSAQCFSFIPFEELIAQGVTEIHNFYRGGDLLTYLYRQLQVVDPSHCTLLKFLFLRSLEPYCRFIRSWIYEAKISDPYGEFIVEYAADSPSHLPSKAGAVDFQLATIREQDGVVTPCFLNDVLVQLLRAGQQLQVITKLLRLCNYAHAGEDSFEDILPSPSDFPTHKVSGYPLSFNKQEIEAIILSRRGFYSKMHEKLEKFMDTIDINYRQVILHDAQHLSSLDETRVPPSVIAESDCNQVAQSMDSDTSSSGDDFSYASDPFESSEYSSTDGSDEQVDVAQSVDLNDSLACSTQHISSLVFSSLSFDKASHEAHLVQETSCTQNLSADFPGESLLSKDDASYTKSLEHSRSWLSKIQYGGALPNLGWPVGDLHQNPLSIKQRCKDDKRFTNNVDQCISIPDAQSSEKEIACPSKHMMMQEASNESKISSSNSFLRQSWNTKYPNDVLSMNPMVTKIGFLQDVKKDSRKFGNTSKISKNFSYFDFSIPTNFLKVFEGQISADQRYHVGSNVLSAADYETSSVVRVDSCDTTVNIADDIQLDEDQLGCSDTSLSLKNNDNADLEKPRGGSSWQGLLHAQNSNVFTTNGRKNGTKDEFDMPLDLIINKCLLQEISLQYQYVSRFCIKLLEGGFDLQEHFLALRRYHFMEIADWADLFITTLWRHRKWYPTEADKKIPEIQGLLESSIQRSSCEKDHNKDRLYVYMKDLSQTPISTAGAEIHSFDFIGLGYRVDWPVNIVLTPSALNSYAEIFTFLIQLKLAAVSLADVWCSLKGLRHLASQNGEQNRVAKNNFSYLVKLRHQVNHFVSTLQQYVLSQLSGVSWCRFCHSLKHEVKDMMDLESVHKAYLMDSSRICFLSDEMRPISNNLQSILQCALDFRSCLVNGVRDVGTANDILLGDIAQINISQVFLIKEKFDKNIKELHLCYLKSPKHAEVGLGPFWSCLNYNNFYSNVGFDMPHHSSYK
ncbi:hypothetical protein RND81_01G050100 [Saponaria officinalis]|uniref:Gamma-tubulin complex component 6 n=1 Tax=Saponaria officinalis TaxID=3572 RepID=A0AAW1N8R6_SAPOF